MHWNKDTTIKQHIETHWNNNNTTTTTLHLLVSGVWCLVSGVSSGVSSGAWRLVPDGRRERSASEQRDAFLSGQNRENSQNSDQWCVVVVRTERI
eukprot:3737398-Heterocapsa_arctica.AAC.1